MDYKSHTVLEKIYVVIHEKNCEIPYPCLTYDFINVWKGEAHWPWNRPEKARADYFRQNFYGPISVTVIVVENFLKIYTCIAESVLQST